MNAKSQANAAVCLCVVASVVLVTHAKAFERKFQAEPIVSESEENPTFPFSSLEFRAALDKTLKEDGDSPLTSCRAATASLICNFDPASFKKAVEALKKLDLINGRFEQHLSVRIVNSGTKVAAVIFEGDRSDPANLFQFIGKLPSIARAVDPSLTSDEAADMVGKFGLMRGDDDPSIGNEKTVIRPAFAASCIQYPISKSSKLHCEFVPRS